MKRTVPIFLAVSIAALLALVPFLNADYNLFAGVTPAKINGQALLWVTIIGGFTLLLGVVSIFRVNLRAYQRGGPDKYYKLLTILSVLVMGLPGLFPDGSSDMGKALYSSMPAWLGPWMSDNLGLNGNIVTWLFDKVDAPMMATMFATLAFYIASAAYRAFRARTVDATMLLVAALIVMFWRVPMGEAVLASISPELPEWINSFMMRGVNAAVQRGIIIGAALGAASMSLRILLGIERIYLGKS